MTRKNFLEVLDQNQNIIHKVCMIYTWTPEDHEDLFQEVVYQAWKSFKSFKGDAKITTWLYRVALYTALTHKKRKKADMVDYKREQEFQQIEEGSQENIQRLYELIDSLSQLDKAIISMYLDGCSYEEIADIMGTTVNNTGVRINRIKKKLKDRWN